MKTICTFPDGWDLVHQGDSVPMLRKEGYPAAFLTGLSPKKQERIQAIREWLDSPGRKTAADLRCAIESMRRLHASLPKRIVSRYMAQV